MQQPALPATSPEPSSSAAGSGIRLRWYLPAAILLLLVAAFFRLWDLGQVPPGMHTEELINAQISERVRQGDTAVIYDEVSPAREGLYYALLAISTTITGRGLILWRLPSVWLAMLSLAVTLRLMRRLYGVRVALMAAGLMAVAFWAVWMGRTVQHVTLLPLTTTVVIYMLARAFQARKPAESSLWFTVGGLALGLAQYVHVTAWTLIAMYVAFMLYLWITNRRQLARHYADIIYALLLAAVICLPLFIFLLRHPGAREPVPLAEQPGLIAEIPERLVASLAAFVLRGDMLPYHNLPGRPVLGPFLGVLLLVGIGVALARWRRPEYGMALLWLLVGMIPTAFQPQRADFEFMAVILPIVFVFPALGLRTIFEGVGLRLRGRVRALTRTVISAAVATLVAGNAVWTFRDYFMFWPQLGDVRLSYQADLGALAYYLDTSGDQSPVVVCSPPVDRAADPFALTNAELLSAYLMHRHDMPIRYFDCTQSLVLASGGESQRIIFPRGHYYDSLPGPLMAWMRYAHDEQVPGIRPDVIMRFEAPDVLADRVGGFLTTALAAWPPEATASGLATLPVSFGYNVSFLGYEIRDDTIRPGDWIEISSYWRLDGPPPPELTLFAHMLGSPVVVIAQDDRLGVDISTLEVRDVFIQYSMIQTPAGVVSGPYTLSIGLYLPGTGQRLPAFEEGAARADRLFLRGITIKR